MNHTIIIIDMNQDSHQYMSGFGQVSNGHNNGFYRFQIFGDENSPIFQNFVDDQDQFKIKIPLYFRMEEKILEPTNDALSILNNKVPINTSFNEKLQMKIQVQNQAVELDQKVFYGTKNDTMELCINFKTMILAFFKKFELLNELTSSEIRHIKEFRLRSPSLKSISIFFQRRLQSKNIRMLCKTLFSSSECMIRILRSRCKMETKLQMIKFIEKMRINLQNRGHITKWKEVTKRLG